MSSQETTAKALMLKLVRNLPEESSFDENLRELAFFRMVDRGLTDAEQDRKLSTEELRKRIRAWRR